MTAAPSGVLSVSHIISPLIRSLQKQGFVPHSLYFPFVVGGVLLKTLAACTEYLFTGTDAMSPQARKTFKVPASKNTHQDFTLSYFLDVS